MFTESSDIRRVKEMIMDTIFTELKNNSKSIGAFALKGGYVLTKYTVKNKNLRCTSDIDMSVASLKVFHNIMAVIEPIAIRLKNEGVIFDYKIKEPYVDDTRNTSGGIKFKRKVKRKVSPNTKVFFFCGVDISIHSMEYGLVTRDDGVVTFSDERSIADKISVIFNRDLYTICRRCRDLYDLYLYSKLNTVFIPESMLRCLKERNVNLSKLSNFEKYLRVDEDREQILAELEKMLSSGVRVDYEFAKKIKISPTKIVKEVEKVISVLRRTYVN